MARKLLKRGRGSCNFLNQLAHILSKLQNKKMIHWSLEEHILDLKFNWKISRGSSQTKTIYIVKAQLEQLCGEGEVAGLTLAERTNTLIPQYFEEFKSQSIQTLSDALKLQLPSHLKFGITSALTDLEAQLQKKSISQLLNKKLKHSVPTSFSLPIMEPEEIESFFKLYDLNRFSSLKIKIDQNSGIKACEKMAQLYKGPLRIDANEAFTDHKQVLEFLRTLKNQKIEMIEQPFAVNLIEEAILLKEKSAYPIFADESLQEQDIDSSLARAFHGVNIKLMKAGSLQQALKQLLQAQNLGLKTMLGCMVETTIGISSALQIADAFDYYDLDGFLFFKEEPFKRVMEKGGHLNLVS